MSLAIFFPERYAKQTVGTFYHNQKNSYNKRKIGFKFTKKQVKNKNHDLSCYGIAVAVLRAQGPSQNTEKTHKSLKQKQSHGTLSDCSWWDDW